MLLRNDFFTGTIGERNAGRFTSCWRILKKRDKGAHLYYNKRQQESIDRRDNTICRLFGLVLGLGLLLLRCTSALAEEIRSPKDLPRRL